MKKPLFAEIAALMDLKTDEDRAARGRSIADVISCKTQNIDAEKSDEKFFRDLGCFTNLLSR